MTDEHRHIRLKARQSERKTTTTKVVVKNIGQGCLSRGTGDTSPKGTPSACCTPYLHSSFTMRDIGDLALL